MEIKSQRNVYPIKDGDCLWFNGAVYGFQPKDNSILPMRGFHKSRSESISKKEAKRVLKEYPHVTTTFDGMKYFTFNPPPLITNSVYVVRGALKEKI